MFASLDRGSLLVDAVDPFPISTPLPSFQRLSSAVSKVTTTHTLNIESER